MTEYSGSKLIPAETLPVPTEWTLYSVEMTPPDVFNIRLRSDVDTFETIRLPGPTASAALSFVNTADFSPPARPFAQRILDYIVNNGYISGSTTTE